MQAMYERVFSWVVNRINDSVQNEMQTRDDIVIGVLDIYGFEIFDLNRYVQHLYIYSMCSYCTCMIALNSSASTIVMRSYNNCSFNWC